MLPSLPWANSSHSEVALKNQLRPEILTFAEAKTLELRVQLVGLEETPKGLPEGRDTRGVVLASRGSVCIIGSRVGGVAVVEHHLSTTGEPLALPSLGGGMIHFEDPNATRQGCSISVGVESCAEDHDLSDTTLD